MCGIAGIWSSETIDRSHEISLMNSALEHRGPDQSRQWHNPNKAIFFGHTRLSILDLSETGMQPMSSESSRYSLVFNGEIYNHLSLRDELKSHDPDCVWNGTSDTETILAAVENWGIQQTCKKLLGMFAIALWDELEQKLYLARDRVGEKPLYYYKSNSVFAFSSELKALSKIKEFQKEINNDALSSYVKFSYIPDSCSIYKSVYKVEPGTILTLSDLNHDTKSETFWSLDSVITKSELQRKDKFDEGNLLKYEQETEKILSDVVASQMLSDVPIGSFLSGGIDSTIITMLMQRNSSKPIKTFSIGFKESRFNESEYASEIANYLGTDHTEFIVTEFDILQLIPNLADIYDEPFADSSQLPTIMLSQLAKKDVTVALTGDGGDEIFGGYNRHLFGPSLWSLINSIPNPLKPVLANTLSILQFIDSKSESFARKILTAFGLPITFIERLFILQESIKNAKSLKDLHIIIASAFTHPNEITVNNSEILEIAAGKVFEISSLEGPEQMMAFDTLTYLPGDILVKVDRASMHSSLETRAPFLDARVIEHSWGLPLEYKISDKLGKKIIRNIIDKFIPTNLTNRPKQGFSIPIDRWLRGDLYSWANEMLSPEKTRNIGIFQPNIVHAIWKNHLKGKQNLGQQLWTVLMAHQWHDSNF